MKSALIGRLQFKRGLNWQQRSRHVFLAITFCAPLMMLVPKLAHATTINVEAENYSTMSGVIKETTTDIGGGKNLRAISDSDWMAYSVEVPVTGRYKIIYRVASPNTTGKFIVKSSASVDHTSVVNVGTTGGWQTWKNVAQTVTLQQGKQTLKIYAQVGGFNLNRFRIEKVAEAGISSASASSVASKAASSAAASQPSAAGSIIIQAENYASMSGVYNEPTTDIGGGKDTGNINIGDWMNYSNTKVKLPYTGKYKITYRVASLYGGGSLALNEISTGATHQIVSVPKTGGWQNWVDIKSTVNFTEGNHYFTILAKAGGFNLNWFKIEPLSTALPLTIQAENYSVMSGIYNEATTDVGGGKDAGNINTGDWMDYKNVEVLIPATASYKITYRVASLNTVGKFTLHEAGGSAIFDTVPVPVTGGWQKWTNVERIVSLPAGKHYFGVKALVGGFNVNWIKMEPVAQPTKVTSSAASSARSSSVAAVKSSSSSKSAVSSSRSSTPAMSASSRSSAANAEHLAGPVSISWTAPDKRENGEYLNINDIGGYEIRYKKVTDVTYTYVVMNDAFKNRYDFAYLEGDYVFQIAAFDKNGIYSPFVDIRRK